MPPQRQDYMLRLLEEQGRFLVEILEFRQAGSYDAALFTVLRAQERLFARPAQDFIPLSLEEQVHLLVVGETDTNARDKCLAHATLLTEAGLTYQAKGQPPLALGAYQLALHVTLLAAVMFPPADSSALRARIAALLDQLPADDLNAEVKELLRQFEESA
ncbi:MAG: hypothetical protein ABSG50_02670 [Opitutaceae bacterium]